MKFDPEDPRWTAYALGELDEHERDDVEALMARSDEARRYVEEILATAGRLKKDLDHESDLALTDRERAAIEMKLTDVPTKPFAGTWVRLAAAAILAVTFAGVYASFFARSEPEFYGYMDGYSPPPYDAPVPVAPPAPPPDVAATTTSSARSRRGVPASIATPEPRRPRASAQVPADEGIGFGLAGGMEGGVPGGVVGGVVGGVPDAPPPAYGAPATWNVSSADRAFDTEAYDHINDNEFMDVVRNPLSTFSIDVDTASYANVRRFINQNATPPKDAVRIEELINYFDYDYPEPSGDPPFSVSVEIASAPWRPEHRLMRIGLRGAALDRDERPAANLVFLLDVSGSMRPPNKLPLLQKATRLLVNELGENDRVAIVVYAGASGMVLPPTPGDQKNTILGALERLVAGGSTNGGAGIALAYDTAVESFIPGGVNRVVLATDGDFNVGVTNQGDLTRLIETRAQRGVFLSVLGFGTGNYKDATLENLADRGNGNYAYIDSLAEARKVLVREMGSTLVTIAKDVKIQIEFNPQQAQSYRLLGYENRMLQAEDFNDDEKDAGEIGAGHTVTALYEIVPAGSDFESRDVDPLKYRREVVPSDAAASGELLTVKLRYKEPDGATSQLIQYTVRDDSNGYAAASEDFKFAAAVAAFGMTLRDSPHKGNATIESVLELAAEGVGSDRHGYRADFIELARAWASLARRR